MSTIGTVSTALFKGTAETTVALANFNFDFSLYKVEAPKEFQGVGHGLSLYRRTEAEGGSAHVTARKLGALFEHLLPSTPSLVEAYGQRATEVSSSYLNQQGRPSHGIFADQAGADGTSIWAAATSGEGAIKAHLLACMLARIWDAQQATSIWVELTTERKQELAKKFRQNDAMDLTSYMSAQSSLSRTQLAEWDSSARAWLRAADATNARKQKQLEIIIDNISTAVNKKPTLYSSVMQAWKVALKGMDCLINGTPQQMQTGELLLGLSAWHLYPDMIVLDKSTTTVVQKDPLVREGGILTIGLKGLDTCADTGVHWSLPLAHLRYYGDPILTTRSITADGSRLSLDELLQVALGCVLDGWVETADDTAAMEWIIDLFDRLTEAVIADPGTALLAREYKVSWLNLLSRASRLFVEAQGTDRQTYRRLIALGKRHTEFLGRPSCPFFGLGSLQAFFSLHEKTEDKILMLRRLTQNLGLDHREVFIRYRRHMEYKSGWSRHLPEYTTAIPCDCQSMKRAVDQSEKRLSGHIRWTYSGRGSTQQQSSEDTLLRVMANSASLDNLASFDQIKSTETLENLSLNFSGEQINTLQNAFDNRKEEFYRMGKETLELEDEILEDGINSLDVDKAKIHWCRIPPADKDEQKAPDSLEFEYLWGDLETAALFIYRPPQMPFTSKRYNDHASSIQNAETPKEKLYRLNKIPQYCKLSDLQELFSANRHASKTLLRVFHKQSAELGHDHLRSLRALASTIQVYKLSLQATISVSILKQALHKARWLPEESGIEQRISLRNETLSNNIHNESSIIGPYVLSRTEALACIVMFESGYCNLGASNFANVMALSTCDSIYIAAPLLCDPFDHPKDHEIHRVMGNIGRAGIALLVAPETPKIKAHDINLWNVINHSQFDGLVRDCFKNTSLHLSFTGSSLPLDVGYSGRQDTEVYILETIVSVHEGGEWVADLDILKALGDTLFRPQNHIQEWKQALEENMHVGCQSPALFDKLVSLQNWNEFIERPKNGSVFQAHGNWQARLAATAVSIAQKHNTLILSGSECWTCFAQCLKKEAYECFTIIS